MKKKIFLTILLVAIVSIFTVNAYAGLLDDIISQGNQFNNGSTTPVLGNKISTFLTGQVIPVVSAIGNLIFAAITVILGAKYIWSSADSKASVMESLPTFVAAVIFFYLGESVVGWLSDATGYTYGVTGIYDATNWTSISSKIIGTVNAIVHYASFGGILFLGLKYMFASAEGKSQMKMNSGALLLGITFVFMASKVVDFIIDIGEGVI